jgi:hypothetical protein
MPSRSFAQLEPLPSHLMGRTLAPRLSHLPGQYVLEAKHAPRVVGRNILRPELEQEQIGHKRHSCGALDTTSL